MTTADNFITRSICEGKKPETIAAVALLMVLFILEPDKEEQQHLKEVSEFMKIGTYTIEE